MNQEDYSALLSKSTVFREMDDLMMERVSEIEAQVGSLQYDDTLENWKKEYRRISTGEI